VGRDRDRFTVVQQLKAPEPDAAAAHLRQLLLWREQHRQRCWPVPPESGWAYAEAERARAGQGEAKAISCWEGDPPWYPGERDQDAMALCFGRDCEAASLLSGAFGPFIQLALELHDPLLSLQLTP
jgi:exodeoxyribonuclease V gamma subunit